MTAGSIAAPAARLAPWSLFAAMIATAGLPIYIHAPKFYVDAYGVGLASMGVALGLLRLVDVVQDPLLGWVAERWRAGRAALVGWGALLMALAMAGLFAVPPPVAPVLWFAVTLLVLFSAFSLLTICFYAQGVARAQMLGPGGHLRLAGWREGGALVGVSLAAVAPVALAPLTDRPFAAFALAFGVLALLAVWAMRGEWGAAPVPAAPSLRDTLSDPVARRLMLLAVVNGAPVAVTSTLFLYFVESRLGTPGLAGPFLLLFFLAAAASAPGWSRLAARHGAKPVLLAGMLAPPDLGAADGRGFAAAFARAERDARQRGEDVPEIEQVLLLDDLRGHHRHGLRRIDQRRGVFRRVRSLAPAGDGDPLIRRLRVLELRDAVLRQRDLRRERQRRSPKRRHMHRLLRDAPDAAPVRVRRSSARFGPQLSHLSVPTPVARAGPNCDCLAFLACSRS